MQVNLNTQNKQSFTAFVTCGGAEQNLRKVLTVEGLNRVDASKTTN